MSRTSIRGFRVPTRRNRPRYLALALLLIVLTSIAASSGQAQSGEQVALQATAGFDGFCKMTRWIPIRIGVENRGPDLEATLEVSPHSSYRQVKHIQTLSLPSVSRKETELYVLAQDLTGEIDIDLRQKSRRVASTVLRVSCLPETDMLFGVLSRDPTPFSVLKYVAVPAGRSEVAILQASDIPDRSWALDSLDALVFADVDSGSLTEAQRSALKGWVRDGGQLIVSGGPNWRRTVAGLEGLLPLTPQGERTASGLSGLNDILHKAEPLSGEVLITYGEVVDGAEVVVEQAGANLLLRRRFGSGQVFFLAADLTLEPLATWNGREAFYNLLLTLLPDPPPWQRGFVDFSSAAQAAATFPNIPLLSVSLVCGFLLLYVLAIGPINLAVLRTLKRRELAWITIPGLVILFSGLAFLVGASSRGRKPTLNRLAIVRVWPGVERSRVDGVVGLFSPTRKRYDLNIGPSLLGYPLPSSSMALTQGEWNLSQSEGGSEALDIRMDIGDVTGLMFVGETPSPNLATDLTLRTTGGGREILEGTITNASDLELNDVVLIHRDSVQSLDDLKPNSSLQLSTDVGIHYGSSMPSTGNDVYNLIKDMVVIPRDYQNVEALRRFTLLTAAVSDLEGQIGSFSGIYLAGWSKRTPLEVNVKGVNATADDLTFYIIELLPRDGLFENTFTIFRNMFNWSVLETSNDLSPSAYDVQLSQGAYSLRFAPVEAIPFKSVQSLTLHLQGYSESVPPHQMISLWNFPLGAWQFFPADLGWGDYSFEQPERFVGDDGEIRLRIDHSSGSGMVYINESTFTLVVRR